MLPWEGPGPSWHCELYQPPVWRGLLARRRSDPARGSHSYHGLEVAHCWPLDHGGYAGGARTHGTRLATGLRLSPGWVLHPPSASAGVARSRIPGWQLRMTLNSHRGGLFTIGLVRLHASCLGYNPRKTVKTKIEKEAEKSVVNSTTFNSKTAPRHPLHPAALASVPYGIVLVRVRVHPPPNSQEQAAHSELMSARRGTFAHSLKISKHLVPRPRSTLSNLGAVEKGVELAAKALSLLLRVTARRHD